MEKTASHREFGLPESPNYSITVDVPHHESDPDDLWKDSRVYVNIGPTHPAMHGALRMCARLNGETIEKSYCEFGYTHRAKEKLGENRTFHNFIVYTDRLNYCSALINNVTYAMSIERLMGIEVPPRAVWIRMICAELARVADHLICVGINAVDLGAFSFFLYGFHQREEAYTLIEKLCGARLTTSYTRIGGLMHDAPPGWEKEVKDWVVRTRKKVQEMDKLLTNNRIWCRRTQGVGVFTREQCMRYSYSGPNARASGIDRDLRRDQPVMYYKNVEFDVPVGKNGDVFDRYLVRMAEIFQSLNIIAQCADRLQPGPVWSDDKRVRIPDKDVVFNTMEGLIHHFKFFMTGFDVPAGEAYTTFEGANGELGFYVVSKGAPRAHRMRIRGPSVFHYQGLSEMSSGAKIADMVANLGSINIIAGELDR
jgi:NADH dehydrogenase I D subunit